MKHGQKPAEPRMEDVLASIRRAIDGNAHGPARHRVSASMAEFRVRLDAPASKETRGTSSSEPAPPVASSQSHGFAGILSGKRIPGETSAPRETVKSREPRPPEPVVPQNTNDGQSLYDGYYGARLEDGIEPAPPQTNPGRFLPPLPHALGSNRQASPQMNGLMSEASSGAAQAAFGRLAEMLARRAPGERPIADVTQELLRGMLKQWLDDNLPKIVERLVREEIERVARRPR